MTLRLRPSLIPLAVALCTGIVPFGCIGASAQNSGLDLHANSDVTATDIGLPAYPGATLYKESSNDSAAVDLGFSFGDFHFTVKAANYETTDSAEQVFAYYRKSLSRYGDVIECNHGKPVGPATITHAGLTCSDQHGGHVQLNGSAGSSEDHELRAGSPHKYRLVGIDDASHPGHTRFGLVYLELPKDSDDNKKPL